MTAAVTAFTNDPGASLGWGRDECEINALRQIGHARNAGFAKNFLVLRVDRMNAPRVRMRMQALPQRQTEAARALGCANHRDGFWFEKFGEFMLRHATILRCANGANISRAVYQVRRSSVGRALPAL